MYNYDCILMYCYIYILYAKCKCYKQWTVFYMQKIKKENKIDIIKDDWLLILLT